MASKNNQKNNSDPFGADGRMESGRAPLDSFIPYPKNPRVHPPGEIELLSEVLKRRGFDQPIVVDDAWVILKGHGRLQAARMAGLDDAPYVRRLGLTETEKQAIRIEDNSLPLLAGWDKNLVRGEMMDLKSAGYDLPLLGFPEAQLRSFGVSMGTEGPDPEAASEPPKNPVTRRGDLWIMGDHRLLCGDATSESDVARCLNGARPHLMVTDSPYGVDYDPDWRNRTDRANGKPYGARAVGLVQNDDRSDWREAWALFPGQVAYCWHAGRHASSVQASLEAGGFEIVCQIIWAKPRFVISRGDYHWQHEPCWYAVRKGKTHRWAGDRSQTTLWPIAHQKSDTGHGTQKPVECMRRPMENNSRAGDYVYDPFVGSGTSIIAAEMTGRRCLAIDIDPSYVDVAVRRWEEFTKRKAVLERSASGGQRARPRPRPRAEPAEGARSSTGAT